MKTFAILAAVAVAGWFLMGKLRSNKAVKEMQEAPVKYTQSLQQDVKKAEAAAAKANAQVERMNDRFKESQKDASKEGQGE